MGQMQTMDRTGDSPIQWDPKNRDEVEAARKHFDHLVKDRKYLAFRINPLDGSKGEQVKSFDPSYERLVMTPPMVGG